MLKYELHLIFLPLLKTHESCIKKEYSRVSLEIITFTTVKRCVDDTSQLVD